MDGDLDDAGGQLQAPTKIKTVFAVWVGLYPTVTLLNLALSPARLPLWQGVLIGSLLSSFIMTFFTMPFYVDRLLQRWLYPAAGAPTTATDILGALVITVVMAFWTVLLWLVTTVFWKLP